MFTLRLTRRGFGWGTFWAVVTILFLAMALDRKPIMSYTNVYINPSAVAPGGTVYARFEVLRMRECAGKIYRTITFSDGSVFQYDPVEASVGRQISYIDSTKAKFEFPQPAFINRIFLIPPDRKPGTNGPNDPGWKVPRGPAIYQTFLRYYCNPLQSATGWYIPLQTPKIPIMIVDP